MDTSKINQLFKDFNKEILKLTLKTMGLAFLSVIPLFAFSVLFDLLGTSAPQYMTLFTGVFIYVGYSLPRSREIAKRYQTLIRAELEKLKNEIK